MSGFDVWNLLASPLASLLAGVAALTLLVFTGKHRDAAGGLVSVRLASAFGMAVSFYVLLILVVGNFLFNIPISETIQYGFGNDRLGWLFFIVIAHLGLALWDQFK